MKRLALACAVGLGVLGAAGDASAGSEIRGLYVGAGIGIQWEPEANAPIAPMPGSTLLAPNDLLRLSWQPGVIGSISVGWAFSFDTRVEIEGVWRHAEHERSSSRVHSRVAGSGRISEQAIMLNVRQDVHLDWMGIPRRYVSPYVGAGIGYGWREIDNAGGTVQGNTIRISDDAAGPVYQLMVGLMFPLEWIGLDNLFAGLEYRYIFQEHGNFQATRISPTGQIQRNYPVDIASHTSDVMFRLKYNFR